MSVVVGSNHDDGDDWVVVGRRRRRRRKRRIHQWWCELLPPPNKILPNPNIIPIVHDDGNTGDVCNNDDDACGDNER